MCYYQGVPMKLNSLKELAKLVNPIPDLTDGIDARKDARKNFLETIKAGDFEKIAASAIGDDNWDVNYSAQERRQGGGKLSIAIKSDPAWKNKVTNLVNDLNKTERGHVTDTLLKHPIKYIKVSVASEIAMILHPDRHLVINKRTIFGRYFVEYLNKMKKPDAMLKALGSTVIVDALGELSSSDLISSVSQQYIAWNQIANEVIGVLEDYYVNTLKKHYDDDSHKFFVIDRFCSQMFEEAKELNRLEKKAERDN